MRIGPWLRIGITSALVAFIAWRVPVAALWSALENLNTRWLWAALASVLAMLAARSFRWHRLLAAGGIQVARSDAVKSLLGGFALSAVTPGRTGELGRCLFVNDSDRPQGFLLNVLDRALDMWALATCAVAGLVALAPRPYGAFALAVWLALLPVGIGLPRLVANLHELPWWGENFRERLRAAGQSLQTISSAPFAALAMMSTSLDLLTFFFLLRALQPVSFRAALVTFPWIVLAGGLPISVGGVGPREGVAALLLARYAIPAATACDAALLLFVFSGLLPALIGTFWLMVAQLRRHSAGWSENLETMVGRT